jgi:hypothetical protein
MIDWQHPGRRRHAGLIADLREQAAAALFLALVFAALAAGAAGARVVLQHFGA